MRRLLIAATLIPLAACALDQPPAQPAAQPAVNLNLAANAGAVMIKDGSHTLRYGGIGPLGVEFYQDDQPLVLTSSATTFRWQGRQVQILNAQQADLLYRVGPASAGS